MEISDDGMERMASQKTTLTVRTLLASMLFASMHSPVNAGAEEDSFALPPKPPPAVSPAEGSDGILRLCEIGGQRIRYSNMAIPGYQICGSLSVPKSCDPTGRRFIGAGAAPYSYLDCKKGQRIHIVTDREQPAFDSASEPMGGMEHDLASLERERKELDALLDNDPKSRGRSSRPSKHDDALSGLPLDLRAVEKVLQSVQGRNDELLRVLQGD